MNWRPRRARGSEETRASRASLASHAPRNKVHCPREAARIPSRRSAASARLVSGSESRLPRITAPGPAASVDCGRDMTPPLRPGRAAAGPEARRIRRGGSGPRGRQLQSRPRSRCGQQPQMRRLGCADLDAQTRMY